MCTLTSQVMASMSTMIKTDSSYSEEDVLTEEEIYTVLVIGKIYTNGLNKMHMKM